MPRKRYLTQCFRVEIKIFNFRTGAAIHLQQIQRSYELKFPKSNFKSQLNVTIHRIKNAKMLH